MSQPASPVFNNAAQVWNHSFYWHSLSPNPTAPAGALLERIIKDFGGLDQARPPPVFYTSHHF